MSRKKFVLFTLFVLVLFIPKINYATDFYKNCLLPRAFGDKGNDFVLTPLNRQCQKICKKECEAFSRKFKPYAMLNKHSPYATTDVQELNQDVILDCYAQCQKGGDNKFEARYFEAFQASCDDEKKEDIFYKVCVNREGEPQSGCEKSLACHSREKIGFVSFYKTLQDKASVGMMCFSNEDNAYNAVETEFEVKAGDKFNFSIEGGTTQNQLFLCGKKYLNVVPIFNAISSSISTNQDDWFKFRWKNKNSHRYLSTLNDQKFNSFRSLPNAKNFWNEILHNESLATSYIGWGARNPSFFDTGIDLQDGDLLSIIWQGDYAHNDTFTLTTKKLKPSDDKGFVTRTIRVDLPGRQVLTAQCLWDDRIVDKDKRQCTNVWYSNSHLKIKDPTDSNSIYVENSTPSQSLNLFGEEFRKGGIENFALTVDADDKSKMEKDTKKNQQYGLEGRVTDVNMEKQYIDGEVEYDDGKTLSCNCDSSADQDTGCKNRYDSYHCINKETFQAGQGQYSLSGVFSTDGEFNNRSRLALMHYDGYTTNITRHKGWYSDNMGGYELTIDWAGCPKSNGENIQYVVAPKGSKPNDKEKWQDIANDMKKGVLTISQTAISDDCLGGGENECRVFLRIKLETPSNAVSSDMADNYKYYNTYGQYYVRFSKQDDDGSAICASKGFVYNTVKSIRNTLVGTQNPAEYNIQFNQRNDVVNQREIGAVGVIFSGFIKQAANLIKIIVILALVFASISYMIGLVDYTSDVFLKLVLKFAIVFALLTERSWEFFGGYMVPFFIDGSVELVARYSAESFLYFGKESCKSQILNDPYKVFSLFDGPMAQLTSSDTWAKIWAICTSSLLGLFIAILLVLAIVRYYFVAVVKATVMFIFAIIIDSLLIVMAPVFIPSILFQKTRHIFHAWAKNLFSYALQPLFVYVSLIILSFIFMMLLEYIFNFTACATCLLRIDLGPLYNECWIPGFQSIMIVHSPTEETGNVYTSFSVYAASLTCGIAIFLVASCMEKFSSTMAGLASWIVTGSPLRHTSIGSLGDQTAAYVKAKVKQAAVAVASAAAAGAGAGSGAGTGEASAGSAGEASAGEASAGEADASGGAGVERTSVNETSAADTDVSTSKTDSDEFNKFIRDTVVDEIMKDEDEKGDKE